MATVRASGSVPVTSVFWCLEMTLFGRAWSAFTTSTGVRVASTALSDLVTYFSPNVS